MREELLRLFENAVEAAQLLGRVEGQKAAGNYTEADSRFARCCYESIAEDRKKLRTLAAKINDVDPLVCGEPVANQDCACARYFARYSCGANVGDGECDCPVCQGYCERCHEETNDA